MKAFAVTCMAAAATAAPQFLQYNNGLINPYHAGLPVAGAPVVGLPYAALPAALPYGLPAGITHKKPEEVKVEAYKAGSNVKTEVPAIKYSTKQVIPTYYNGAAVVEQEQINLPAAHDEAAGGVKRTVFKRDAESQYLGYPYAAGAAFPYAAAATPYAAITPYGVGATPFSAYNAYNPYAVGLSQVKNDAVTPFNYGSKGQYIAKAPGFGAPVHIAKREAEADSEADAQFISTYGSPYVSTYGGLVGSPVVGSPLVSSYSLNRPVVTSTYAGAYGFPTVTRSAYQYYL